MVWYSHLFQNFPQFIVFHTVKGFLGWEDALEKGMAMHSSILSWRIPWSEKPGGVQSMESKESDMTERLTLSLSFNFFTF